MSELNAEQLADALGHDCKQCPMIEWGGYCECCEHRKQAAQMLRDLDTMRDELGMSLSTIQLLVVAQEKEIERLRAERDECIESHQRQNAEVERQDAEIDRLRAANEELKQRVDGGLCKILSKGGDCNCALCARDDEIERLRAALQEARRRWRVMFDEDLAVAAEALER